MKNKKIIAIHGAGMTPAVWRDMSARLPDIYFEAVALPGHGDGKDPLSSVSDMAAWIEQGLAREPPASVVLAGHSMGALVALMAARHPAVCAVIFVGAALEMPVNADLLSTARDNPEKAGALVAKWSVFSGNPQAENLRQKTHAAMQGVASAALYRDLAACDDFKDGKDSTEKLGKPVLIISGAEDKMVSAAASAAMSEFFFQSSLVSIPACGHMTMLEKPDEVAREIARFIADLPVG